MISQKKIGLALGSGSMKGVAHIGVIKVLIQEKIPIHVIAGSSIGAVIGALYCAGVNWSMLEKFIYQLRKNHLVDITVPKKGLIEGKKIYELLKIMTKNKTFAELSLPLAVTATDLEKGELVVITDGNVADAVRASISIPGIFKPVTWRSKTLVDGAVLDRVPVSTVKAMGAEIIIAVDVKGKRTKKAVQVNNIFDVIMQSIELLDEKAFNNCCAEADVIILPEVPNIGLFDLESAEEIIMEGEKAALQQVGLIKDLMYNNKNEFLSVK